MTSQDPYSLVNCALPSSVTITASLKKELNVNKNNLKTCVCYLL